MKVCHSELVTRVAERERVARVDARRILDATVAEIVAALGKGDDVVVGGLGTFRARGEPGHRRVAFRRSPARRNEGVAEAQAGG